MLLPLGYLEKIEEKYSKRKIWKRKKKKRIIRAREIVSRKGTCLVCN